MIEDPLYLPKDTPVYMIGNMSEMAVYETAKECKKEWEKFGYQPKLVPQLLPKEYDFFPSIKKHYDRLKDFNSRRINLLSTIALWKKHRRRNQSIIIANYDSYILRDIPVKHKDDSFLYLSSSWKVSQGSNDVSSISAYYLNPRMCAILYKHIVDEQHPEFTHVETFTYRLIRDNDIVNVDEKTDPFTIKYIL